MPVDPLPNRVLCVAEKPSIAKEISRILGQGNVRSVSPPLSLPPLLSPDTAFLSTDHPVEEGRNRLEEAGVERTPRELVES